MVMESGVVYYWLLLALHALAILFFTHGFLLTRTELPHFSHCSHLPLSPCFPHPAPNPPCWTNPAVHRIVLVVLDALRFDFVAPSSVFQGEKKPWMDKLKVLQELATRNPSSARIFKAIADPPTTSLQRLKGLTTGGLPTFIDVGNSFGAPAIIEDNLLHQLAQNGKRVVMMGDDTWMQLFPHHFTQSYPFPSFNVKDLDTVDNGCIEHLVPSLYKDDWDVLIAHFLGVDHAGHIFGVDSVQMLEKLEQYNLVLENVIDVLKNESGPGGLHENTLLLVMGDHGQTLNGDHGGGSPEEVETSIFAMNFKKPVISTPSGYNASATDQDMDKKISINSFQQLDFAGTISALLGIPFPFGSIGQVNRDLYALGAGIRDFKGEIETCKNDLEYQESIKNYVNVLCINSWQVKRYIDVYSASSLIGFSLEDLFQIEDLYSRAVENWSRATKDLFMKNNESCDTVLPALEGQIDAYTNFLARVAELARSKWTEFNLRKMTIGFGIMLLSIVTHIIAITRMKEKYGISFSSSSGFGISFSTFLACFIVAIRASSFLSNSYILEEGKVASFLLATSGVAKLRDSIARKKNIIVEVVVFLLVITACRLTLEFGVTKQTPGFNFSSIFSSWVPKSLDGLPFLTFLTELMPILSLIVLAILMCKAISKGSSERAYKYIIVGTILSYVLIAGHWVSESNIFGLAWVLKSVGKNSVPQIVYAIGIAQLSSLTFHQLVSKRKAIDSRTVLVSKTMAILSTCSSTIIVLSGKQGALISIAAIIGGYCITRLGHLEKNANSEGTGNLTVDPLTVTQWSLLAVCLFFCTGHWCAFDGLRYGAAFIGFDEFFLVRQAILLAIDTFGASLILPIFGLPFLVVYQNNGQTERNEHGLIKKLLLVYLLYGLVTATTVTATMMCVAIHRRHLMVWGLFAPKFVFDVIALLLTDLLTGIASLYYF